MMELRVIGEKLLIRPDQAPEKVGLIVMSDYTKKRPTTGIIISMGEKVDKETFKLGQWVVYGDMSPYKINVNLNGVDEELFLMHPDDIWAIEKD